MKHVLKIALVMLVLSPGLQPPGPILRAQAEETCPAIVQAALTSVDALCARTARNQACYGNRLVAAEAQPGVETLTFESPGDLANVAAIRSLSLSGMDEAAAEWGISLLRLQANLPDTLPGQNVTFLLLGDVDLRAVPTPIELPVTIAGEGNANVRRSPATDAPVIGSLAPGTTAAATGRSAAGDWLRIRLPDSGTTGWVAAFLVQTDGDLAALDVVEPGAPAYGPMQAFYLRTGLDDAPCAEAPASGLLVQTPQGAGTVEFSVNEVSVHLGSTAYFQAQPGESLVVHVVEGQAHVAAFDVTQTVPEGAWVSVPLDENLAASGPPTDPIPYSAASVAALPVGVLPEPITIAPPAAEADLAVQTAPAADTGVCAITAPNTVNLRGGPGTEYTIAGRLSAGSRTSPNGRATGADGFVWWRLPENQWVRSDVVQAAESCAGLPAVSDIPPTPTPAPTSQPGGDGGGGGDDDGGGAPSTHSLHMNGPILCLGADTAYPVGEPVEISLGMGAWSTEAEAAAHMAASSSTITVNGQGLPVTRGPSFCPADWCPPSGGHGYHTIAMWIPAAPGTYTIVGTAEVGPTTCVVTVGP